jgi:REP element-mobilizing transposase RayT
LKEVTTPGKESDVTRRKVGSSRAVASHKSSSQVSLGLKFWGGKRRGAGRKNLSGLAAHAARPDISMKTPLHVTLKLTKGLPNLRTKALLKIFRASVLKARLKGLRIIHYSLQSNHMHLLVEAHDKRELASVFKSLGTSLARRIRAAAPVRDSRESIFRGRYHLHVLRTPTEVKNALRYVLLNETKHTRRATIVDEFSSGSRFGLWKKLVGRNWRTWVKLPVAGAVEARDASGVLCLAPTSWLLKVGWQRVA